MVTMVASPVGHAHSPMSEESKTLGSAEIIASLEEKLSLEKKRSQFLADELAKSRQTLANHVNESEAEEECITNKLCKQVSDLKKEKEKMAIDAEREEEYLTNNLQKEIFNLRKEKVSLENLLEQEQEFAVNRLQKQLKEIEDAKLLVEHQLEAEKCNTLMLLEKYQEMLRKNCDNCLSNQKKGSGVEVMRCECSIILGGLTEEINDRKMRESTRTEEMYSELQNLKDENFLLRQRVNDEHEKRTTEIAEKVRLSMDMEQDDERMFNELHKLNITNPSSPLNLKKTGKTSSTLSSLVHNNNPDEYRMKAKPEER